jgi:2-methylisocitrate lyase-like PEP mutase family enzyme
MVVKMTNSGVLGQRAAAFLAMHTPGDPVILPTVWDVWSARLAVGAGFGALTVGSKPVAESMGKSDGEGMTFAEVLGRARQITEAVDVPVSLDIESGYGESPARLVEGLLEAGAVGCNIEDSVHSQDKRLRSASEHAEYVAALRQAADTAGTHLVINARTDLFLRKDGDDADRIDRAIARLTECANAGADVLYPVGRHDAETLRLLAAGLPKPVNALAAPDQDDPASFGPLGIGRISFGPLLQVALGKHASEVLGRWR